MKTHYSWILINWPVIFMWVRCLSPALVFGSTDWMSSRNKPFCHRTGLGNIPRSQQQFLLELEAPFSELLCGHWIWRGPRARSDNTEIERHKRPRADTPGNTIDRQTDRQAGRQAGRQTDRQTYIHLPTYLPTYIHTYIHTYTHTHIHTYTHTHIHTYTHTHIHTYTHTDIQTYRHTDIQTYIHTYIHTYIPWQMSCFFLLWCSLACSSVAYQYSGFMPDSTWEPVGHLDVQSRNRRWPRSKLNFQSYTYIMHTHIRIYIYIYTRLYTWSLIYTCIYIIYLSIYLSIYQSINQSLST